MHSARLEDSPRLQRVLAALKRLDDPTSLELLAESRVVGLSAAVSELRDNGAVIKCWSAQRDGRRVWLYRLLAEPGGDGGDGFRLVPPGEAPA